MSARFSARLIYITDRKRLGGEAALRSTIEQHLAAGVDAVYLRENDLSCGCYENLAGHVAELCSRYKARLILPFDCGFAKNFPDAAIQVTGGFSSLSTWAKTQVPLRQQNRHTGFSAHSLGELRALELLQESAGPFIDYVFLSPIFATSSKPNTPPLGLETLRAAVEESSLPVYALGGITPSHAKEVLSTGCAGIAAISVFQNENADTTTKAFISHLHPAREVR